MKRSHLSRRLLVSLTLVPGTLLFLSGCGTTGKNLVNGLARGAAEQPYQDAMQEGRLPPSEYQEIHNENALGNPPSRD